MVKSKQDIIQQSNGTIVDNRNDSVRGAYIFECSLIGYPTCKRIVQIPSDIMFADAAVDIIRSFGLTGYDHVWEFYISGVPYDTSYGIITTEESANYTSDEFDEDDNIYDGYETKLSDIFEEIGSLSLVYDMGDDWQFDVDCIFFISPDKSNGKDSYIIDKRLPSSIISRKKLAPGKDLGETEVLYSNMPNLCEDIGGVFAYDDMLVSLYALNTIKEKIYDIWKNGSEDGVETYKAIEKMMKKALKKTVKNHKKKCKEYKVRYKEGALTKKDRKIGVERTFLDYEGAANDLEWFLLDDDDFAAWFYELDGLDYFDLPITYLTENY